METPEFEVKITHEPGNRIRFHSQILFRPPSDSKALLKRMREARITHVLGEHPAETAKREFQTYLMYWPAPDKEDRAILDYVTETPMSDGANAMMSHRIHVRAHLQIASERDETAELVDLNQMYPRPDPSLITGLNDGPLT